MWKEHYYLDITLSGQLNGLLLFFTYFLLLNTMLPISLIISLEIAKIAQAFFMEKSKDMYSEIRDQPCKVFSSSLNEELGMIKHIFTDKTGTLTCNRMKFRFCTIGKYLYGYSYNKLDKSIECLSPNQLEDHLYGPSSGIFEPFRMSVGKLILEIKDHKQLADQFLKCMTLCHECIVDRDTGKYTGPSPDEIAILETAKKIGFNYQMIGVNKIQIKIIPYGSKLLQVAGQFEHFCTLEFSSDRKRNSVIVRDLSTGYIMLYCKGADNIIKSRLSMFNSKTNTDKIYNDLELFAKKGYRTLLLAFKIISEEEFKSWKEKYDEASRAIYEREEQIEDLADIMERELILLGCTALEDSLQEQVPETIKSLLQANIKVWMLTGDKLETAVNIGKTCGLIEENTYIAKCKSVDPLKCQKKLEKVLTNLNENNKSTVLVIEGDSLETILSYNPLSDCINLFFKVSESVSTVICCRVSPGQKKKVVSVMKNKYKSISLSVGDGANDVSMILEANIGIGIYGEEGMQAVQASDFAIGEFRFLWDLLINHGRMNYIRQSEMILYFFYKNMVFTIPQFYFAFYCFYSGQTVYDDWYITCYNMIFTALPLMIKAVLDKDIIIDKKSQIFESYKYILPSAYQVGQNNQIFTGINFTKWIFMGFLHSGLVFYIPLYIFSKAILSDNGENSDFWSFSITSFTCIILLVTIKLCLSIRFWTIWHIISLTFLSFFLYLGFIIVYDQLIIPSGGTVSIISRINITYFSIFCVLSLACSLDIAFEIFQKIFSPNLSDNLQKKNIPRHSKIIPLN